MVFRIIFWIWFHFCYFVSVPKISKSFNRALASHSRNRAWKRNRRLQTSATTKDHLWRSHFTFRYLPRFVCFFKLSLSRIHNRRMINELLSWERGWVALSYFEWCWCEFDWTYRRDGVNYLRCCWTCSSRAASCSRRRKCRCIWRRWLDSAASCLLPRSLQVNTVKRSVIYTIFERDASASWSKSKRLRSRFRPKLSNQPHSPQLAFVAYNEPANDEPQRDQSRGHPRQPLANS